MITISATNGKHELLLGEEGDRPRSTESVIIKVQDGGPGVPAEDRARIFDPYFTTKAGENHDGMGLAQGMSIARKHSGILRLDPQSETGNCFELILPALVAEEATDSKAVVELEPADGKTILLVDDEEPILEAAQVILEGNGFNVLTASDGAQAIAKFSEHSADIHLVLTDLMMPYMDGAMLSKAIRDISTTVPIFIATGLDSRDNLEKLEGLGVCEVIPKPFAPKQLVQRICQELSAA